MHEGTIDARESYLRSKPRMGDDTSAIQTSYNNVIGAIGKERKTGLANKKGSKEGAGKEDEAPGQEEATGKEMWFWDDWFGLAGDDIGENLNDNSGITDWDDEEYDSMPSITLHAGVSTQVPRALFVYQRTRTVIFAIHATHSPPPFPPHSKREHGL
jgi:hypothetical protein